MAYQLTDMAILVVRDPAAARHRMLTALQEAHGDRRVAAEALGVGLRSWHRYARVLGLTERLAEIQAEHHRGRGIPDRP